MAYPVHWSNDVDNLITIDILIEPSESICASRFVLCYSFAWIYGSECFLVLYHKSLITFFDIFGKKLDLFFGCLPLSCWFKRIWARASIAQWLEHWSCKPGVVSSILTGGWSANSCSLLFLLLHSDVFSLNPIKQNHPCIIVNLIRQFLHVIHSVFNNPRLNNVSLLPM